MPVARFQMPDGRIGRFEVPEGTTPEQAHELITSSLQTDERSTTKFAPVNIIPRPESLSRLDQNNPTIGMSTFERGAAGMGKAFVDAGRGAKQMLDIPATYLENKFGTLGGPSMGLPTAAESAQQTNTDIAESRQLDAPLMRTGGGVTGNIAGNVAMAAPTMLIPGANTYAGSALVGAGVGALQPVTGDESRLKNAVIGGTAGFIGKGAAQGVGKIISPTVSAPAKTLLDQGVTPTPGQILGGGFKRVEDAATSIPVLGDAIKSGQQRAIVEFNKAAINKSLEPIGEQLPKGMLAGNHAIEYAGNKLGKAYDDLLPKLNIKADKQFTSDLSNLTKLAQNLPDSQKNQFERIIKNEITDRFTSSGLMSGETMKNIESKLGGMIRGYGKSQDYDQRSMGQALQEAQASLRSMVMRNNPDQAPVLQSINEGYANFLRVQNAAAKQGAKEGVFSPAQFRSAVRAMDSSKNKGAFAKGKALGQDFSDAATNVLGQNVPDSGTPLRALVSGGILGGAAYIHPGIAGGALAATLPYTPMGQKLLATLLTKRPGIAQPAGEALRRLGPAFTVPAASQGAFLNREQQ